MAKCSRCGTLTDLRLNGVPVCVKCVEEEETKRLEAIAQRRGDEDLKKPN